MSNSTSYVYSSQRTMIITLGICILVMMIAFSWSTIQANNVQKNRTAPLDIDGWAHRVSELKANHSITVLFEKPSAWKGPIVPFIYGLVYYLFPYDSAILVFNSLCFALASGLLIILASQAGLPLACSVLAALGWIFYPPHGFVHGYYFAESVISLLVLLTIACYWKAITNSTFSWDILTGILSGVLLLARPPFVLALSAAGVFLLMRSKSNRMRRFLSISLGAAMVIAPWIVRNYSEFEAFVPFTLEGGKILYQGTYLPGDDLTMNELRKDDDFARLEQNVEKTMTPIKQYQYWQAEAKTNLAGQPLKQGILMLRKAIRFWAYLPRDNWIPKLATGIISTVLLVFGLIGVLRFYDSIFIILISIFIMATWVFHSIVHAELRYNFSVINFLMLLAMLGAFALYKHVPMLFLRK